MVINARSQWGQVSSPIKSNYFSFEKKILRFPDEIGVGVQLVNDFVNAYHLQTNKIMFAGSYQKQIKQNIIRVGVEGGVVFRSINTGDQTFPDQWNYSQGIYDNSISSGETNITNSKIFPNFSIGTGWTRRFGLAKVSAGYALFNLLHPQDGFVTIQPLPFRHVFNTSVTYSVNPKTNIIPHLLYMNSAKAVDFIIGTNVTYLVKDNAGILLGGGYRGSSLNSDAVIGTAGLTYKRFQFGFSMDFTVSKLNVNARNKSAWEIMITYTTPSRIPGKVTLPCDRY
jgi:type IX secretion system PorP/SprF family membrane protein